MYVPAPLGKLSLHADFADVEGEAVKVYVINRTDKFIGFLAQDRNPYLKLEGANTEGEWERAQVHWHSWCGNSYDIVPILAPDQYFVTEGFFPSDGKRCAVRYRVFAEHALVLSSTDSNRILELRDAERINIHLVSNAGHGHVREPDLRAARADSLAPRFGDFEVVRNLATGTTKINTRWLARARGLRSRAMENLYRFPGEESLAILGCWIDDEDWSVRTAAMTALAKMSVAFEGADLQFQSYLRGEDPRLRVRAIWALGHGRLDASTIAYLQEQAVLGEDESVRLGAIVALSRGCGEHPEINEFFRGLVEDPDIDKSLFERAGVRQCLETAE